MDKYIGFDIDCKKTVACVVQNGKKNIYATFLTFPPPDCLLTEPGLSQDYMSLKKDCVQVKNEWAEADLNRRHTDFQAVAGGGGQNHF